MKKLILPIVFIFVNLLFISCSSDSSEDSNNVSPSAEVMGSWALAEININPPQDVNEDGTASTNVLNELSCLNSTLLLNNDFTWSLSGTDLNVQFITGNLYNLTCKPTSSLVGTWGFSNNTVILTGNIDITLQLSNGNTLTNLQNLDLPDVQSVVYVKL
ncbi:hypothetical protein GGR42_003044 [Saonia flava]|uniref:Lipocalin-like domain-containing protein n=1 Tax=Saonia flava TaxID=523696 RepID=A0A846R299_9FLAO|nr:hypothetical protein [Saonia flava]NJB72553.1 hypothetical protein [Saonia flava]